MTIKTGTLAPNSTRIPERHKSWHTASTTRQSAQRQRKWTILLLILPRFTIPLSRKLSQLCSKVTVTSCDHHKKGYNRVAEISPWKETVERAYTRLLLTMLPVYTRLLPRISSSIPRVLYPSRAHRPWSRLLLRSSCTFSLISALLLSLLPLFVFLFLLRLVFREFRISCFLSSWSHHQTSLLSNGTHI